MPVPVWIAVGKSLLVGTGYGLALTNAPPSLRFDLTRRCSSVRVYSFSWRLWS